jgi:acetate kinase
VRILVLNSGSSSIKYKFFDTGENLCRAEGQVERIGLAGSLLHHRRADGDRIRTGIEAVDHGQAIETVIAVLLSKNHGVISKKDEIEAVGHRVAHGGERLTQSVLVTDEVRELIQNCIELAPLHNPHNLMGIDACAQILPGVPQVAVFDTAFHHKIPAYAYFTGGMAYGDMVFTELRIVMWPRKRLRNLADRWTRLTLSPATWATAAVWQL